jgi:DNA-directed RNA polymerase specialized sigma24 family protein
MSSGSEGPEWIIKGSSSKKDESKHKELLESARRLWPKVFSFARRQDGGRISVDEIDRFATEAWEKVLVSVARTLERSNRETILNLDAYLLGVFQHRYSRAVKLERKRRSIVQIISPDELIGLADFGRIQGLSVIERDLQVKQIVERMDEWTRSAWISRQYGFSWKEVGAWSGISASAAKMRFRYAITKLRGELVLDEIRRNECAENTE